VTLQIQPRTSNVSSSHSPFPLITTIIDDACVRYWNPHSLIYEKHPEAALNVPLYCLHNSSSSRGGIRDPGRSQVWETAHHIICSGFSFFLADRSDSVLLPLCVRKLGPRSFANRMSGTTCSHRHCRSQPKSMYKASSPIGLALHSDLLSCAERHR
jgi:hypothetical protein